MAYISVNNVSIKFPVYHTQAQSLMHQLVNTKIGGNFIQEDKYKFIEALKNISFMLTDKDRLGLIGHNGAGKTTLLKLLAGIYEPTSGSLHIQGQIASLLDISAGMNTELTGIENIYFCGLLLGLSIKKIKSDIQKIIEFTELGDFINMPVNTYSSGMIMRLAFALRTWVSPNILLLDEMFGTGDQRFIKRAQQHMRDLMDKSSIIILASHNMTLIQEICTKVIWLEHGSIKASGSTSSIISEYMGTSQKELA